MPEYDHRRNLHLDGFLRNSTTIEKLTSGDSVHNVPHKEPHDYSFTSDVLSELKRIKAELEEDYLDLKGIVGYEMFLVYYLIESGHFKELVGMNLEEYHAAIDSIVEEIDDYLNKIARKDGERERLEKGYNQKYRPTIGIEVEHHSNYGERNFELDRLGVEYDSHKEIILGPAFSTKKILRQLLNLYKLKRLSTVTLHITVDKVKLTENHTDFMFIRLLADAANFLPRPSLEGDVRKLDKMKRGKLRLKERYTKQDTFPYHDRTLIYQRVPYGSPLYNPENDHMVQARSFSKSKRKNWFFGVARLLQLYEYASIGIMAKQSGTRDETTKQLHRRWEILLQNWIDLSEEKFGERYPKGLQGKQLDGVDSMRLFSNQEKHLMDGMRTFHSLSVAYGMSDPQFRSQVRQFITRYQNDVKIILGEKKHGTLSGGKGGAILRRIFLGN